MTGWWFQPIWKIWKSVKSVGMIIPFPIYGKSIQIPWFQSPPTRWFCGSRTVWLMASGAFSKGGGRPAGVKMAWSAKPPIGTKHQGNNPGENSKRMMCFGGKIRSHSVNVVVLWDVGGIMRYIFSISGHSQIEPMTRLRSIPLNLSKFPPVVGWQSMLFQLLLNRPWSVQPLKRPTNSHFSEQCILNLSR